MTFKKLKDDDQKIVCQCNASLGNKTLTRNLSVDPATTPEVFKSRKETFAYYDTVFDTSFNIPEDSNY